MTFSAQRFQLPVAAFRDGSMLGQSNQAPAVVDSMVPSTIGVLVPPVLSMAVSKILLHTPKSKRSRATVAFSYPPR